MPDPNVHEASELRPAEAHAEVQYDQSDLSARGIVIFLIALAVTVGLIHLISWSFFRYLTGNEPAAPAAAVLVTPPRATQGNPVQRFPAPVLQPDPVADLDQFRTRLDEHLHSYGWVDQKAGVVHIPIERAMELVAQQGLPVREPPALPPHANFGSGDGSPAGAGAGTEPRGNR